MLMNIMVTILNYGLAMELTLFYVDQTHLEPTLIAGKSCQEDLFLIQIFIWNLMIAGLIEQI